MDRATIDPVVARREVLGLFATAAGAAAVVAYVPDPLSRRFARRRALASGAATAVGLPSAAGATTVPSCVVRPRQTEGPYFADEKLNRSDIRSDPSDGSIRQGVQLALTFAVARLDGSSCVPSEGVLVDVWHCDAAGIYSDVQDPGFNTTGKTFLRGYQVTDANGAASFVTIYPAGTRAARSTSTSRSAAIRTRTRGSSSPHSCTSMTISPMSSTPGSPMRPKARERFATMATPSTRAAVVNCS